MACPNKIRFRANPFYVPEQPRPRPAHLQPNNDPGMYFNGVRRPELLIDGLSLAQGQESDLDREWEEYIRKALQWLTDTPLGREVQDLVLTDAIEAAQPRRLENPTRPRHNLRFIGTLLAHAGFIDPLSDGPNFPDTLPKLGVRLKVQVTNLERVEAEAGAREPLPFEGMHLAHWGDFPAEARPRRWGFEEGKGQVWAPVPKTVRRPRGRKRKGAEGPCPIIIDKSAAVGKDFKFDVADTLKQAKEASRALKVKVKRL